MKTTKVLASFSNNGDHLVLRYPRIEDQHDMMVSINSLIRAKSFVIVQKRQTAKQSCKYLLGRLREIRQNWGVALVVECNSRVVGSANITRDPTDLKTGELGISMSRSVQDRGIGKKLMKALIAEAKKVLKIRKVTLSAFLVNHRAVALYRKVGFREICRRRRVSSHFGVMRDRIYMAKRLR